LNRTTGMCEGAPNLSWQPDSGHSIRSTLGSHSPRRKDTEGRAITVPARHLKEKHTIWRLTYRPGYEHVGSCEVRNTEYPGDVAIGYHRRANCGPRALGPGGSGQRKIPDAFRRTALQQGMGGRTKKSKHSKQAR